MSRNAEYSARAAKMRQFVADHPGCGSLDIIAALDLPKKVVWHLLNNQAARGLLEQTGEPGKRQYWPGREPIKVTYFTPEERRERRAAAQKRTQERRKEQRRSAREATPRFVLPTVPLPPQAPAGSAVAHVETVEEFLQRNPGGYVVIPKVWPEPHSFPKMHDSFNNRNSK